MNTKLMINGSLVDGQGEAHSILNPATGGEIVSVRAASEEQVQAAVAAATDAFDHFGRSAPAERAALLLAIADKVGRAQPRAGGTGKFRLRQAVAKCP